MLESGYSGYVWRALNVCNALWSCWGGSEHYKFGVSWWEACTIYPRFLEEQGNLVIIFEESMDSGDCCALPLCTVKLVD